ncbi:hypothetical protein [Carboxylicivirga marina]|uniref:VanZ-like domain-containing protein n=1 Tax=Carboxylicivirga marina TaxID=2800988 RepID=A0ABS1HE65_9BACT|nr:hypothetical protein [Carboxylicivirga marina]MBK3515907.1 hypothetical protein [Carboxylicivirga marina]
MKVEFKNRAYLIVSVIIVSSAILLTKTYRPYIYSNNINDFGFADTIGSLISVIGYCFFIWGLKEYSNRSKNIHIITSTIIYSFLWEFIALMRWHGTFDWKDILAGIFSGIFTFVIKEFIEAKSLKTPKSST